MRAAAAVRARGRVGHQRARADPAHRLQRGIQHLLKERVEVRRRQPIAVDAGQARVGVVEQQATRARVVVAAQRLVEPPDRLQAEELRERQQVEPDLQARLVEPLGLWGRALALVVVDDRLVAGGTDVDTVDAALQAQLAAGQLGRPQRVPGPPKRSSNWLGAKAERPWAACST